MNNKTWEEYKKTLTAEQYTALVLEALNDEKNRLNAEIKQKEKELKRLKRDLYRNNEAILLLSDTDAFMAGA